MKLYSLTNYRINIATLLAVVVSLFVPTVAWAFSPDVYAPQSVLASGRWIKVSVPSTGVYCIPQATLRKWGFSNPSAVRVYGYGGARIPDYLTADTYVDDLPQVPYELSSRGLIFYAVGPDGYASYGRNNRYRTQNPFSSAGYYYLTDNAAIDGADMPEADLDKDAASGHQTTYQALLTHERDITSPGETGHLFVGEDFMYTRSQTFTFDMPDRVEDTDVWMRCSFIANAVGSSASLVFTANGERLPASSNDVIGVKKQEDAYHGTMITTHKTFNTALSNGRLSINITLSPSGSLKMANLDAIHLNYQSRLTPGRVPLMFEATGRSVRIEGAGSDTRVWDVTNPQAVKTVTPGVVDGGIQWTAINRERRYAVWNDATVLPAPALVGEVANQNLHAIEAADMVIFTTTELKPQARRLAALHENSSDSMRVHVIEQSEVFNEFTSGLPDPNAFRRMLKMLHDRGGDRVLRYAILLGRGSYDNRALTAVGARRNTMPLWQTDNGENDDMSYCTDDVVGVLADNSGLNLSADSLTVAVGRIPATTLSEATAAVDKIEQYMHSMPRSTWKNRLLMLADDQNQAAHMEQCDKAAAKINGGAGGHRFLIDKIYIDAYEKSDGGMPAAREELYRKLDEGVMMWFYVGHGNRFSLTAEKMVLLNDINTMYLRHYPVLYAATCNFMRWDGSSTCGAEVLHFMEGGGTIATISANRPVYIADNGNMLDRFGTELARQGRDGRFRTIGEIYRSAKNAVRAYDSSGNRLRYALMGDPALHLITPSPEVRIETLGGVPLAGIDQPTLMANQDVRLGGAVYDADGTLMDDFDGQLSVTLYDADYSTLSYGYQSDTIPQKRHPFDRHGNMLYAGSAKVQGGRFDISFAMPSYVAGNFRETTLNMYASETAAASTAAGRREASGVERGLYVYGYDSSNTDDTDPLIESMVLNHSTFASGDKVNQSPMLLASISDDRGINLSTAGVGQQMSLLLDGNRSFSDVSLYYEPDTLSGRCAGAIRYPLSDLTPGDHSLRLRIWDTSGNMAERTIGFKVVEGLAPKIFDVYTDASPAIDQARFYIDHNRPDQRITVKMTVYNMLGSPLWTDTQTGRSDMFISAPFVWNLTDGAGHRVPRGIYIYRAEVSHDGSECAVVSRRLAVAGK